MNERPMPLSSLAHRYPQAVDPDRADMTPLSPGALTQMLEQYHEQADEGHARLRESVNKLELQVSTIAAAQAEMRLALLKAATPDLTSLRLSPSTLVAILAVVFSLAGGFLTIRDSIAELRKGEQLNELKLNELTNTVLDAIRKQKP